jgi:hypothetical protein
VDERPFSEVIEQYDPETPAVAVDFETYYDNDCSVSNSTYWHYTHHPKFKAYMVSIYSPEYGISFVGDPLDFDWTLIHDMLWLAHNSPFDRAVRDRLVETCPEGHSLRRSLPTAWVNTADLAVYSFAPRSLKGAVEVLLDRKRSKQVRNDMKGKTFANLSDSVKQQWLDYAMDDAVDCYDLWEACGKDWPLREQLLSLHTSECVKRGVAIDVPKVEKSIDALKRAVESAERNIPWAGEQDVTKKGNPRFFKTGEPRLVSPTSPIKIAQYARECNIPLPTTTGAKSEEFQEWERVYGERFPVIKAVQTWRKTNRLLKVYEQIKSRIRDDGRMELQLCYFGAQATGRWSGKPGGGVREGEDETGLNMQNLPKDTVYLKADGSLGTVDDYVDKVDTRSVFIAPEGKKYVIADLSQIEPRCLAWLCGDEDFLVPIRQGQSPYEAHARASMGWTGGKLKDQDKAQYAFAKARVLSLGYAAGWQKFISMAAMYIGDPVTFATIFNQPVDPADEQKFLQYLVAIDRKDLVNTYSSIPLDVKQVWVNSWLQVTSYRDTNPKITSLWAKLQKRFKIAGARKEDFFVTLPSGRKLAYFEPRNYDQKATRYRGGPRTKVYGGLITENITQATARDVFGEGILRLERAGYPVLWHVHDEAICEVVESADENKIVELLAQPPEWMKDLPVGAEAETSKHYCK